MYLMLQNPLLYAANHLQLPAERKTAAAAPRCCGKTRAGAPRVTLQRSAASTAYKRDSAPSVQNTQAVLTTALLLAGAAASFFIVLEATGFSPS